MRVALVLSNPLPAREGIGTYATQLARRIEAHGHEAVLFTRRGPGEAPTGEAAGFRVVRPWFAPLYPVHVQLHARPMAAALASHGPFDVVHLHSPLPPPLRQQRATNVLTMHTPMALDVRSLRWDEPMALLARLQLPVAVRLEKRLLRQADAVTAVSASVARALETVYGVEDDRVQVVPNGVDVASIRPVYEGRTSGELLYVGRLAARKGLMDLVDAMGRLGEDSFRLNIVGEGPLRPALERAVHDRGLQGRVVVHGFLPREALQELWGTAMLFVHVPAYEGMPTSLLEAMAHGLPVVTTDAPGTRDVVADGRSGRLVPVRSAARLVAVIKELAQDEAQRLRLARGARAQVESDHDWRLLGARMLRVYAEAAR